MEIKQKKHRVVVCDCCLNEMKGAFIRLQSPTGDLCGEECLGQWMKMAEKSRLLRRAQAKENSYALMEKYRQTHTLPTLVKEQEAKKIKVRGYGKSPIAKHGGRIFTFRKVDGTLGYVEIWGGEDEFNHEE